MPLLEVEDFENRIEDMEAKALQIVTTGDEHTFVLDEETLTDVLLQNDIKDRFVIVISVAGAFRKGKSFLLDFFLRYMYSKVYMAVHISTVIQQIAFQPFFTVSPPS